jgi:hypothetical protein
MTCTFRLVTVDGAPRRPAFVHDGCSEVGAGGHDPARPEDAARRRCPQHRQRRADGPDRRGHLRMSQERLDVKLDGP